ncbi:MAG: hypothetical protein LUG21_00075, partial [Clostridiales bacterium]|nr:hypothetical protein [Clostridiales bacterium]
MIKVNWQKIKKFEQKGFALPVIIILALFAVLLIICAGFMPLILKPVKFITCVFIVITIAFKIHIESRMLQIYMLLGLTDISFLFAAFVPVTAGLTMLIFGISLFSA